MLNITPVFRMALIMVALVTKYYIVACDASGYTDFTRSFSSGNGGSFRNGGYIEPTLSARAIYYIIGVDGRGGADETEMWKKRIWPSCFF